MSTLFASPSAALTSLTDKYCPSDPAEFIGLEKAKKVCAALTRNPMESGFIFVGDSGMGKTKISLALASAIPAELHHIPSQDCNLETLRRVVSTCHYVPREGYRCHLVLVDEADQMTAAAQMYLLSKLDGSAKVPNTIFIFTCNSIDGFEVRFRSRNQVIEFSNYGVSKDAAALLERVWLAEANGAPMPNFARIVKEANNNIRAALMELQTLIMLAEVA